MAIRRRRWHPTPVLLPGKSHGRRSLVGCSPWGRWESDTTEQLHFHFSLSCIGEGNDNPLQYSCLENSRDGGAWWAAVYGVAQNRTRLKQLSSSSKQGWPPFLAKQLPFPAPQKNPTIILHTLSLCISVVLGLEREKERETERVCVCKVSTHSQEIFSDKEEE